MKKRYAVLLFLGWLIPAGMALAESPILVSHTLTGYSMGADSATLSYILTVRNAGTNSVSNLTLLGVPFSIINRDETTFYIGSLESQSEVHLPFTITTPLLLDQATVLQLHLFWVGKYTDLNGNAVEYSARSYEGGAL